MGVSVKICGNSSPIINFDGYAWVEKKTLVTPSQVAARTQIFRSQKILD